MIRLIILIMLATNACLALYLATSPRRISFKLDDLPVSTSGSPEVFVPDMSQREAMNAVLVGAISFSTIGMAIPYFAFFLPKSIGKERGVIAKDVLGEEVTISSWKMHHQPGSRELVQGLQGDATYLILDENKEMENYALNAVCTHLGCVVPWNSNEKKFICNCHGSQYDKQGSVIRGPAPLSLALAHREVKDDKVVLRSWTEVDFRSGKAPWWK